MNKVPPNAPNGVHFELNYYLITLVVLVFFFTANWMYNFSRPISATSDVEILAETPLILTTQVAEKRETNRNEQMLSEYFGRMGLLEDPETSARKPLTRPKSTPVLTPTETQAEKHVDLADTPSLPELQTEIIAKPKVTRRDVQFLLYPKGGESFCFGQEVLVRWDPKTSDAKTVDINLVAPWGTIRLNSVPNAKGSYTWKVQPIHVSSSNIMGNVEIPPSKYYALALEVETPFMPGNNMSKTFSISGCK